MKHPRGMTPAVQHVDDSPFVRDVPFTADDFMGDTSGAMAAIIKQYQSTGQRLGQFFCDQYVKEKWDELYHEEDNGKAKEMIREWLVRHQYFDKAPPRIS